MRRSAARAGRYRHAGAGGGPLLLLLHAGAGSATQFEPLIAELDATFT